MLRKIILVAIIITTFSGFSQTITFSDPNLKAALLGANVNNTTAKNLSSNFFTIDANHNGEIEVNEAIAVSYLYLQDLSLTSTIGMEYFTNLTNLNVNYNQLNALDISSLTKLIELNCTHNQLTKLELKTAVLLKKLNCEYNLIDTITFDYNSLLTDISVDNNKIVSLSLSGLNSLINLDCSSNQISNCYIGGIIPNLQVFNCSSNQLTSLNLTQLSKLITLLCNDNKINTLDVSMLYDLTVLNCEKNVLKQLYFTGLGTLQELNCGNNQLNALIVSGLINVKKLDCNNNQLTTLDCSKLAKLEHLYVYNNLLTDLNVQNLSNLQYINCNVNNLASITLTGLKSLQTFYCSSNKLTQLDFSSFLNLQNIVCDFNKLTVLNLKNGILKSTLDFSSNPTLKYICVDNFEWDVVQTALNQLQYSNCEVNSYCTLVPGGVYYTITGATKYDSNKNGCDASDGIVANQKFTLSDGANIVDYVANKTGSFSFPVAAGTYTLSPEFENTTSFNATPATTSVVFPNTSSTFNQDQCVSTASNFSDLEIVMFPTNAAIPGGLASYKIILKNKGNYTQSGTVKLLYNTKAVASIYSTNPTSTTKFLGEIDWNFSNLAPFAYNRYTVTFKLNTSSASSPVKVDDVVSHQASFTTTPTDQNVKDNVFTINHTVENTATTNKLICLEGTSIGGTSIGDYIHYVIHYKNTGTSSVKNLVIKTVLDTNSFDPSTLEWTEASESGVTKISKGNTVEFIYENINFPVAAEGYLAYKIKTLQTLKSGDKISNSAEIYMDLNKRIQTNITSTTIQTLGISTFDSSELFYVYPNPTKDILHLKVNEKDAIKNYIIYSVVGQELIKSEVVNENAINVSSLLSGNYIIRMTTNNGTLTKMFLKE
ncbi:DUF7619 domain-containing protein [Flavobacterium psychrotolerans]|uniref:Uncharacterized protein n=1 Tax=Flavobacterium psychrotolerans TaxID=2169410 RepID=A0A2U1JQM4_9FLAO|nr:T9SS type A sorting domain-containing protein [Flavobacterium psychrotolerans]PWA07432.1 hypothetical protein DB895_01570 [Flavobacterium psychrotolerans]